MKSNGQMESTLIATTFNTSNSETRIQFETWVRSLTRELDNEAGDDPDSGTWSWVVENNSRFTSNDPYGTFIFEDPATTLIVGTASFVKDDREVGARLGLCEHSDYLGMLGFFQVHRDHRKRGFGRAIAKYMNDYVQNYIDNTWRRNGAVYLFSVVPHAMEIAERLGFSRVDRIDIIGFGSETLFKKVYQPYAQ